MGEREPAAAWTVGKVLDWATDDFRARGLPSPRLDAEVLLAFAVRGTRIQLVVSRDRVMAPDELARFRELVKERRAFAPVAYLVGVREFYGRPFRVDRRVLVPRPDTETLVEVALARTRHVSMCMRALDLCTGSGCVAVTLARERPTSRVHATDLSSDALELARENALRLGAYNVSFARADLYEGLDASRDRFDLITANPPYIPTAEIETLARDIKDHEPRQALDGGADGLVFVRRIVADAPRYLVPGGTLAVEVAAGQAPAVASLLAERGFTGVASQKDYGGIERVVAGAWSPRASS